MWSQAYMHARGVIHGDLSRANILLLDSNESSYGFDVKVSSGPILCCSPTASCGVAASAGGK